MSNSIGIHDFCFLRRADERGAAPELLDEQKSILRRPGTDGTSVRHEGKAGVPFRVRTMRDFDTVDEALAAIDAYKSLEEQVGVAELIWESINYATEFQTRYAILRVGDFSLRRVRSVSAPAVKLSNNANYLLDATWDLLPVTPEDEPAT